jgi:hypothetical protein
MSGRIRPAWALVAAFAAILSAAQARAAPSAPRVDMPSAVARTVSYSTWTVEGAVVRLRFILPHEARRALAAKGARPLDTADLGAAILAGVGASSRGGDCEAIDQGEGVGQVYPLALDPRVDRFEIVFQCADALGLVLHDHVLFAQAPDHIDFAQVTVGGGKPRLEAFTRAHQDVAVRAAPLLADPTTLVVLARAARSVFEDPLRLCALLAVLLTIGRWPGALKVGGAVAAGYALAFAAAAAGLEAPEVRLARALEGLLAFVIAVGAALPPGEGASPARGWRPLSIVVAVLVLAAVLALAVPKGAAAIVAVAGAAVVAAVQAAAARRDYGWRRIQLMLVGGLAALDGLGQTTLLAPLDAGFAVTWPILAETVVGAAGAVCAALAAAQAARWLAGSRLAGPRALAGELAAAALAGAGLFWFASQLYSW